MVFPIGPVRSSAHEIEYSCDFNGSNEYMLRRPSTAGSERIATYRFLLKRSSTNSIDQIIHHRNTNSGPSVDIYLADADRLNIRIEVNNSLVLRRETQVLFNNTTDWYDICIQVDGNQTDDSCCTVEVNGVKITSFNVKKNLSTPRDLNLFNTSQDMLIGARTGGSWHFDGLIAGGSLVVDGTNYSASKFGKFVDGSWEPKRITGVDYGTNGFMFDFADSSNLGNDVSGNNNDFTTRNMGSSNRRSDTPTS